MAVQRADAGAPVYTGDPAGLTPVDLAYIEGGAAWAAAEGAYIAMHRTKPQTAAFGLTDSPAGLTDSPAVLAAWIVEKLRSWSDNDGDVERSFTHKNSAPFTAPTEFRRTESRPRQPPPIPVTSPEACASRSATVRSVSPESSARTVASRCGRRIVAICFWV
jgi:hypothetical protein